MCVMRLRNDFRLKCSNVLIKKIDALYLDLGDLKQSKSDGERREREVIQLPSSGLPPPPHPQAKLEFWPTVLSREVKE